jgi:hypothetical protein
MPGNLPLDSLDRFAEYQKRWPQYGAAEVCDICSFTPESGHVLCNWGFPLWANSRHCPTCSITSSPVFSKARRHGEAERFGGLEIDDQVELGWRLYRQVGRLCAFED